jgi:predicted transglutaminase-like protease
MLKHAKHVFIMFEVSKGYFVCVKHLNASNIQKTFAKFSKDDQNI